MPNDDKQVHDCRVGVLGWPRKLVVVEQQILLQTVRPCVIPGVRWPLGQRSSASICNIISHSHQFLLLVKRNCAWGKNKF
jgi:hypothetical protein